MTEIQILQRLKNDGVFPYLDRNTSAAATKNGKRGMQNIHLCFFMRRWVPGFDMPLAGSSTLSLFISLFQIGI
jgi:hypothetical protein